MGGPLSYVEWSREVAIKQPTSGQNLADFVKVKRNDRGWGQKQLAAEAGISVDSVRRLERGDYQLPTRPLANGHPLDRLGRVLGFDVCAVVRSCFSERQIAASDYRRCLSSDSTDTPVQGVGTLRDYIASLPSGPGALISQAALLNAHAMAYLIALEREYPAFEFLVSNQPPFMLFADDEYITTGSSSVELDEADRQTYHTMIFEHRARVRGDVERGQKHYRVVLHKESLIAFLNSRSRERATRIVEDVKAMLRCNAFDLVMVEDSDEFEEFEVLSRSHPIRPGHDGDAISVRHRRVGLGNTLVYQLAVIGTNHELVSQDYHRAENLWQKGLAQYKDQPEHFGRDSLGQYAIKRKRITANMLNEALRSAHPG